MSISEKLEISEEEEILLGLIYNLEILPKDPQSGEIIINDKLKIKMTKEGIMELRTVKDKISNYPATLDSLIQRNFLSLKDRIYSLTETGRVIGKKIRTKQISEWFGDVLVRSANSQAYALFCERVFGKNLSQFNVLDMDQLESMIKVLNLNSADFVLDLGCGVGKIADYISTKTGARILGIDFAEKVIHYAQTHIQSKNDKIEFQVGNINELNFPPSSFTAIIAIDTLYSWNVEDMDATIAILKEILTPNGQMGIFAAQFREENEPQAVLNAENTKMAKILAKNGLTFQTIDFTENARHIWLQETAIATELKDMFEKEGNLDLCEDRLKDSKQTLHRIDSQQQRRYFYHVRLSSY
ncbi:MAG: class I SAM-dependent methyltransferase [Candidatus Hodarchaeota archaeon]